MKKQCSRCEVVKGLEEFHVSRRERDGHVAACKACVKSERKERFSDPKERDKQRAAVSRAYCGLPKGGFCDHIQAKSRGGADDWTNLTGACEACNMSKGTLSVLAFLGRRDARERLEQQVKRWRDVGAEAAA